MQRAPYNIEFDTAAMHLWAGPTIMGDFSYLDSPFGTRKTFYRSNNGDWHNIYAKDYHYIIEDRERKASEECHDSFDHLHSEGWYDGERCWFCGERQDSLGDSI